MKRENLEEGELSSDGEDCNEQGPDRRLYDTQRSFERSFSWLENEYQPSDSNYSSAPWHGNRQSGRDEPRRSEQRFDSPNSYERFLSGQQQHRPQIHTRPWQQGSGRMSTPRPIESSRQAGRGRERSPEEGGNKMRFDVALSITGTSYSALQKAGLGTFCHSRTGENS